MRAARTISVTADAPSRLAALIALEIDLLATHYGHLVAFEVDEIDAVAEPLAELATFTRPPRVGLIDARELADQFVEQSCTCPEAAG
jgi:hypothetical protein